MSKYVKDLITAELKKRFDGVEDALLVNVVGMPNEQNVALRRELRRKQINLVVVKNSLARRATEGTALAPAFEGVAGTLAVLWGGDDLVSLAKEVVRIAGQKEFAPFAPQGGVMDGQQLSPAEVTQVAKWPSRAEQLSILVGQILSPGANLSAQLLGPGSKLNSQIEKKGEGAEVEAPIETPVEAAAETPVEAAAAPAAAPAAEAAPTDAAPAAE
jgi:large subunit ribosomal protein L10